MIDYSAAGPFGHWLATTQQLTTASQARRSRPIITEGGLIRFLKLSLRA